MSLCSVHPQIGQFLIFPSTSFISRYMTTQVLFEVKAEISLFVYYLTKEARPKDLENRCSATVV